jgi:hypothetical protein
VAANGSKVIATFGDPYDAVNTSVHLWYTTTSLP